MASIKEVITILCKYLNDTIESTLTPEHFRLAKYDNNSDDVINAFWVTLDKLTYFTLKQLNSEISVADFDKCLRTKFRLAYLEYPCLEIYCSSGTSNGSSSRAMLIALTWLITTHNVLENIVRLKLLNSSLGQEFSKINIDINEIDDANLSTVGNQINNLLHKTNKLSNNLKAISELYAEKIKLMTKVHAASITVSGLPHLSVSEMSLIKTMSINKDNNKIKLEEMKEMEKTASILETKMKWEKTSFIFLTWMNTVQDEYEKAEITTLNDESQKELAKFIYILRVIIKKRLSSFKNSDNKASILSSLENCPSRFLRAQKCITEIKTCLTERRNLLENINEELQQKRIHLNSELQSALSLISNCNRI